MFFSVSTPLGCRVLFAVFFSLQMSEVHIFPKSFVLNKVIKKELMKLTAALLKYSITEDTLGEFGEGYWTALPGRRRRCLVGSFWSIRDFVSVFFKT